MSRRNIWLTLLVLAACAAGGWFTYRYVTEQQRLAALAEELRAEEELQKPLQKIVTLKFGGPVTLKEWLAEFSRQSGIQVEFVPDTKIIAASPYNEPAPGVVTVDTPIALELPPLPAEEALQTLKDLFGVRWQLRPNGVVELNFDDSQPRVLQTYVIPPEFATQTPNELGESIMNFFDSDEWEQVGGRWSLEATPSSLVLLMPPSDQRRMGVFLERLKVACRHVRSGPAIGYSPDSGYFDPIWLEGNTATFARLQQVLDSPITLTADDTSWPELIRKLTRQVDFPIVVHPEAQSDLKFESRIITCRVQETPLRLVLRELGVANDVLWTPIAGGRALLLSSQRSSAQQVKLAYPTADLVPAVGRTDSADELIDLITSTIETDSWADVGGPGYIESFDRGRLLLISQSFDIHQRVQELLTTLRTVNSGTRRQVALAPDPRIRVPTMELDDRLNTPLSFHYVGEKQKDAFEDIFYRGDIRVPALEGGLWHAQGPIWIHLPARPLRENLAILLSACHYDVNYLDHVTHRGLSQEAYVDHANLVSSLAFDRRPWLRQRPGWPDLEDLLYQSLDPDHWSNVGGPGNISSYRDALIVQAHPRVLNRAQALLAALEQHLQPGPRHWEGQLLEGERLNQPLDLHSQLHADALREHAYAQRNEEIRQKLQQRITLKVTAQHVGKTMLELAREHELPIVVTLLEAWPNDEQIAAVDVENKPLGDVLQQLIGDSQEITWQVRNGCLTLSDPNVRVGSARMPPYLYTVDDLMAPRGPFLPKQLERTLEEAIKARDNGKSLDELLGPQIEFQFGNLLLVWYDDPEQPGRKLFEQLLRDLRSGKLKPVPVQKGDADFSEPPDSRLFGSTIPVVG